MTHPRFFNLRQGGNMPPSRSGRIRAWIADTLGYVVGVICIFGTFWGLLWIIYALGGVQ